MTSIAKIFTTGRSQAVRLPLEFRCDLPEVFIRHDPTTGDVVFRFFLIYQVLENLIGFAQAGAHYELYSSPPIRYLFLTIFYTE